MRSAQLAALGFGLALGLPQLECGAQGEPNLTAREQCGFIWPEDINGNESFFGHDILVTIDDCQQHEYLQAMFDTLQKNDTTATFFPNSRWQQLDKPDVVQLWRDIYAAGNDVGYHTTDHYFGGDWGQLGDWSVKKLCTDFDAFTDHMREVLGDPTYTPHFARPPYGSWNDNWMKFVHEKKLTNVRWNFVPNKDDGLWFFDATVKNPRGGRVILLHPREWDSYWLGKYIGKLVRYADSEHGRVIRLSGGLQSIPCT